MSSVRPPALVEVIRENRLPGMGQIRIGAKKRNFIIIPNDILPTTPFHQVRRIAYKTEKILFSILGMIGGFTCAALFFGSVGPISTLSLTLRISFGTIGSLAGLILFIYLLSKKNYSYMVDNNPSVEPTFYNNLCRETGYKNLCNTYKIPDLTSFTRLHPQMPYFIYESPSKTATYFVHWDNKILLEINPYELNMLKTFHDNPSVAWNPQPPTTACPDGYSQFFSSQI